MVTARIFMLLLVIALVAFGYFMGGNVVAVLAALAAGLMLFAAILMKVDKD